MLNLFIIFGIVQVIALTCAAISHFAYQEMDYSDMPGILSGFAQFRDKHFPMDTQNRKYRFFGIILGQCQYCMNCWINIIAYGLILALWWHDLTLWLDLYQKLLLIVPVVAFSNLWLRIINR